MNSIAIVLMIVGLAAVIATDSPQRPKCGRVMTTVTEPGLIGSPIGKNGLYPSGRVHIWRIQAPLDKTVKLEFVLFQVQRSRLCNLDVLVIRDGGNLHHR
jgi:hypothetical protein